MNKKNILVFPCGSEVALEIHAAVKNSTYFNLIGLNSVKDHGKFVYNDYAGDAPYLDSKDFFHYIKSFVHNNSIEAIYPATDLALTVLKKHENELGCYVISSNIKTTNICLSKHKTYSVLKGTVDVPTQYFSDEDIKQFPIFGKPDVGHSSRGVRLLCNMEQVEDYMKENPKSLLLEYLPGDEYTVDCFTSKQGVLLYAAARTRSRIKDGISVNTTFVDNQEEFALLAQKINKKLLFRGGWFFQVKRDKNGHLKLLEVATRIAGSSALNRARGVNLPLMTLFDAFGYDIEISQNNLHVELDRALDGKFLISYNFNYVYVDYDDCLILNKKHVNYKLVSFIFKCINEGKRIILLSKHNGNLNNELKKFRLNELFDEVYHLNKDENKYDYIRYRDSIFIDDSFAERKIISESMNIPVFGPEVVGSINL